MSTAYNSTWTAPASCRHGPCRRSSSTSSGMPGTTMSSNGQPATGPLRGDWSILHPGEGGSEAKTKGCAPKIDLQVRAPLIHFIFVLRKHFLMWGGVSENPVRGGGGGGGGGNSTPCPPPPHRPVSLSKGLRPGRERPPPPCAARWTTGGSFIVSGDRPCPTPLQRRCLCDFGNMDCGDAWRISSTPSVPLQSRRQTTHRAQWSTHARARADPILFLLLFHGKRWAVVGLLRPGHSTACTATEPGTRGGLTVPSDTSHDYT